MTKTNQDTVQIEHAAAEAIKVVAAAASEATKIISAQALEAAKSINLREDKYGNDHDLIIEIKTVQQTMLSEIREIKDGTAKRIADLEDTKLDIKDSYVVIYKKGIEDKLLEYGIQLDSLTTSHTRVLVLLTVGSAILTLLISLLIWHIVGK